MHANSEEDPVLSSTRPRRTVRLVTWGAAVLVVVAMLSSIAIVELNSRSQGTGHTNARIIYVSPRGDDNNPGTFVRPVRSLETALHRAAAGSGPAGVTIALTNGVFRLRSPLDLTPQDSGTPSAPVRFTAAPNATPLIAGSLRVRGWMRSRFGSDIWVANVPARLKTRQLYVNGVRAYMSSGALPVAVVQTRDGYLASSSLLARWRNASSLQMVYSGTHMCFEQRCPDEGLGRWTFSMCNVSSIHNRVIRMQEPCWNNSTRRVYNYAGHQDVSRPDFIQNAFELLKRPGQFYLDSRRHRLYYIPRTGEHMQTADVEAPVLQRLVSGNGTLTNPIHDISFSGIEFAYATWLRPGSPDGFSEVQSGMTLSGRGANRTEGLCQFARGGTCPYGAWTKEPGNVQFRFDQDITFRDDRFVHLGGAALNLDDGTQHATVSDCVFTDVSGNGIELGNVDRNEATGSAQTINDSITDNYLSGLPTELFGGVAMLLGYVSDTTVSHNQIDHTPYAAISIGWSGWPERRKLPPLPNNSHGNVISHNLIFDILQRESDGGGIYNQGSTGSSFANGEQVRANVIHGVMLWGRGLHSDQGTSYVTYANNVLFDNQNDAGANHIDRAPFDGAYDPLRFFHNYWQQDPDNEDLKGVKYAGNHLIQRARQAPLGIRSQAGIARQSRSILKWRAAHRLPPSPPSQPGVLYAYAHSAYVAWEPSLSPGTGGHVSYTVSVGDQSVRAVSVSAATFQRYGYAVIRGLKNGRSYQFTVTAHTNAGSSAPSPSSKPALVGGLKVPHSGRPHHVFTTVGNGDIAVVWYPAQAHRWVYPALRYVVRCSDGSERIVEGPNILEESDRGGRVVTVFAHMRVGHRYRFSIQEITPAGRTRPVRSAWVYAISS
jgi:hypothetical protein